MDNIVTTRLNLLPLKLEIIQTAITGNAELASVLGVKVLPNWQDEEFLHALPELVDILCKNPLQAAWGWGNLVIHQAENTLIGHVMVKIIPDSTGSPTGALEIGYYIAPSYRQQGYATEATKAIVDWAFCQPIVQSVTAGCDVDNIGSKRVLEKIGMQMIASRGNMLIWKLSKTVTVQ
ncbi:MULTISPECIES: GNAT family N-acetyltransferase [unclassified Anabaena]|uniref:GNAT family N-acetyltransferase n=1 Tax=unclassified Anabaena TaxID=2619674 RepID=UPI00082BB185|nr:MULTISPECIES: GNAT family N-acetyltransferase [unclassified Anabaena]